MIIQVKNFYAHNDLRNFSYLIWDKSSGYAWAIDPFDEGPIIDYIKKNSLELKGILNTHQHWDHIRGNLGLQKEFNCLIYTGDQNLINLGEGYSLKFLQTPGHTLDHQSFLWESDNKALGIFSGDTLFNSGVGNCKNGGDVELLFDTTNKLKTLSDEIILYPGHDYALKNLKFAKLYMPENKEVDEALRMIQNIDTQQGLSWTLGQEKRINPFFQLESVEVQSILGLSDPKDIFKKLRSLRDQW